MVSLGSESLEETVGIPNVKPKTNSVKICHEESGKVYSAQKCVLCTTTAYGIIRFSIGRSNIRSARILQIQRLCQIMLAVDQKDK